MIISRSRLSSPRVTPQLAVASTSAAAVATGMSGRAEVPRIAPHLIGDGPHLSTTKTPPDWDTPTGARAASEALVLEQQDEAPVVSSEQSERSVEPRTAGRAASKAGGQSRPVPLVEQRATSRDPGGFETGLRP